MAHMQNPKIHVACKFSSVSYRKPKQSCSGRRVDQDDIVQDAAETKLTGIIEPLLKCSTVELKNIPNAFTADFHEERTEHKVSIIFILCRRNAWADKTIFDGFLHYSSTWLGPLRTKVEKHG